MNCLLRSGLLYLCYFLVFIVAFPCFSKTFSKQEYLEILVNKSREKDLSKKRYWHILLHYKKGFLGGWESETDATQFFNAKDGKFNPATELESTLQVFFAPLVSEEESHKHPQCRFIARFDWLDQHLNFDPAYMPRQKCKNFQNWLEDLNPESLTLAFPSYYIKTPASMFGHTLLRINTKGNDYTSILNYAINYAANVDPAEENAIAFAVFGTFGGYPGTFSVVPYYSKIQEYNDIEHRDIWEYHLNFSRDEIIQMLKHLWELKFTYFDYYFFRENCSYHLLALMEAARPTLNLQEGFLLWTVPGDTIRKLIAVPGLVIDRSYRPSRYSMIRQKFDQLNENEQDLFQKLISDHKVLSTTEWNALSIHKKALILEAANDYYMMQSTPESKKLRFQLLRQRARLKYVLPDQKDKVYSSLPENGHKVSRVGISGGINSDDKKFIDLFIQPSFHNLMAYDEGHFPNSEIEFLKLTLRQYENENTVMEELVILSIGSFVPRNRIISPLSWHVKGGIVQNKQLECTNCPVYYVKGSAGFAYTLGNGLAYSMMEGQFKHYEAYDSNYQAGVGMKVGVLSNLGERWKANLSAGLFNMFSGHTEIYNQYRFHIRYLITVNSDIRLEWDKIKDTDETKMSLSFYF